MAGTEVEGETPLVAFVFGAAQAMGVKSTVYVTRVAL